MTLTRKTGTSSKAPAVRAAAKGRAPSAAAKVRAVRKAAKVVVARVARVAHVAAKSGPAHAAKRPGIGFIAPSGQVLDPAALDRAIAYFTARGYRVVCPAAVSRSHQRFAGSDQVRLSALHAMLARADVDVVMAVRGGYGLSRLLDRIDYRAIAQAGKILVGHSDFTALTAAQYAHGHSIGYCGPTAAYDFGAEQVSEFTERHFFGVLEQPRHTVEVKAANPYQLKAAGRIWGGNLAMIALLAGTPHLPRINNGLLFVEDINEHPYRIERMLYQLHYAGVLKHQRALLLGDFSGYQLGSNDNGFNFETMVDHLRERLGLPVITGLPFGHCRDKLTIPFGAQAALAVSPSGFSITLSDYPYLQI